MNPNKSPSRVAAEHYVYFDHDAGVGLRGCGTTLEEAFEAAATAMFATMTDLTAVRCERSVHIEFEEADVELALVRWLNLLLDAAREHAVVFAEFRLERDGVVWHGLASGEPGRADLDRGIAVTGATLTALRVVWHSEAGWEACCVVGARKR